MIARTALTLVLVAALAGCSDGDDETTPTTLSIAETIALVEAEAGDDLPLDYEQVFADICADPPAELVPNTPASIIIPARCPDAVAP
jgi:hypothetical protein